MREEEEGGRGGEQGGGGKEPCHSSDANLPVIKKAYGLSPITWQNRRRLSKSASSVSPALPLSSTQLPWQLANLVAWGCFPVSPTKRRLSFIKSVRRSSTETTECTECNECTERTESDSATHLGAGREKKKRGTYYIPYASTKSPRRYTVLRRVRLYGSRTLPSPPNEKKVGGTEQYYY